jgi:hypothetical protein
VTSEIQLGGNLNDAVRIGDTVHRRAGPYTPAVHSLLRYLERAGFEAPRVIGMDAQGREVLRFIEGEAHSGTLEPLPDRLMADAHVVEAGRLLRRYHDVVAGFRPPPNARWRLVAPTAYEVICHNDWSPWNALMRDGRLEVMLDWDLAGPGTRLWDIANAAYCWAPLFASRFTVEIAERARRLRLFLDAYGLEDRSELLVTLRTRLDFEGRFVQREADAGDVGMKRLVAMGVPKNMTERDVRDLDAHWSTLERAL